MKTLFEKTRAFVEKSFKGNAAQMRHFDRTVYWLEELNPRADEAARIAAIGHDIERAFQDPHEGFGSTDKRFTDIDELRHHQEKGAEILAEFLQQNGADDTIISRVKHLISRHEIGGDADQNVLKDADSLSFVENNADIFLLRLEKLGYDKVKEKFDWMYNRISDPKAKMIAKRFYEDMIQKLNNMSGKNMRISNTMKFIVAIIVCELAGIVGSFFTMPAIQSGWYATLTKPELAPPNWIFGPVWTILFALMGVAVWLVWKRGFISPNVKRALIIFDVQLVLNVFWSIIFFGLRSPGSAFIEIIVLWFAILATIVAFAKISRIAAWLMVPYILWVSFASYLNYAIWLLN